MSTLTSLIILVCLFGSCTPQEPIDVILSTLVGLAQRHDTLLQKIDGLENKMTSIEGLENKMASIEESQKALEERIIGQQEDIRTSIQQCCFKDQFTTFQHLIEKDECEEGSAGCSASATCTDAYNQYKCVCIQGYSGDGFTCEDIDECNTNDAICGEGSTCINHPGTYGCLCHDGFIEVNNFCTDVEECSESSNVCGAEQICSNVPGNYTCTCHEEGYEKEGDNYQDINECATDVHLCSGNATCTNTKGNYTCQCLPFYYGDGFTCNDCQTELNKARKVLLDTHNIGMDDLTPEAEYNLIKSLEQKEPQCIRNPIGSNCKELLDNGWIRSSVYIINPEGFPDDVAVYCDQETDGGGWSVILQRKQQTQQLSFVKTFEEYAAGFGDPEGEIWIGNRVLHSMTGDEPFTLRVDAKNLQGESRTGIWNTFSVGSQDTQFTLSVAGYSSSSTLGDALTNTGMPSYHRLNGMKFSTYDRDNDKYFWDCSGKFGKGGWWYNACSNAFPTAPLGDTDDNSHKVSWNYWERSSSGRYTAISEMQFKIRP